MDIFIRRLYNPATGPSRRALFLIDGGPGFSANALAAPARFFLSGDPGITAYLIDQRGTGLSSPLYCQNPPTVPFTPEDPSVVQLYKTCMLDVMNTSGGILEFFSTYHGAMDYVAAVTAINPTSVAIYALSYGTYFTNMYLQLPGARADAVVLDGPVPCNRWALENNAQWVSRVAMSNLRFCGQFSSFCANKTGLMGQVPRLVMDSVVDGTLPCLKKLPWLNQRVAAAYSSFMTLNQTAHVLMAPFWFRLYRCSDSDVTQLNVFHARMADQQSLAIGRRNSKSISSNGTLFYEYALGLAVNIGASEVYSYGSKALALNYSQQLLLTSRVFADASPELVTSFAREFWPLYTPNPETYMKFARPTVPVIVTVGTLDPNTPHGNGAWLVNGLGNHARLITIPFAAHGTLSPGADCANSIISTFLLSLGTETDTSCLQEIVPPDYDGVEDGTRRLATAFFGTDMLWGMDVTTHIEPVPGCKGGSESGHHTMTSAQLAGVIIGSILAGALATALIAALAKKTFSPPGGSNAIHDQISRRSASMAGSNSNSFYQLEEPLIDQR